MMGDVLDVMLSCYIILVWCKIILMMFMVIVYGFGLFILIVLENDFMVNGFDNSIVCMFFVLFVFDVVVYWCVFGSDFGYVDVSEDANDDVEDGERRVCEKCVGVCVLL